MSEASEKMNISAYEKLTDSVVDHILMNEDENGMKKAKDLIHRIYKRQLYKVVGRTDPKAVSFLVGLGFFLYVCWAFVWFVFILRMVSI